MTKNDRPTNPRPTFCASSSASLPPNCAMPTEHAKPTIINSKGVIAILVSGGEAFHRRHMPTAAPKIANVKSWGRSLRTRASRCGRCSVAQRPTVATAAMMRTVIAPVQMMSANQRGASGIYVEANSGARDHTSAPKAPPKASVPPSCWPIHPLRLSTSPRRGFATAKAESLIHGNPRPKP